MNRRPTAIIWREGDGYVAFCPEVDVASQGETVAEARANLAEAVALFFETASREEVAGRLRDEVYVTQVEVAVDGAGTVVAAMRPARQPESPVRQDLRPAGRRTILISFIVGGVIGLGLWIALVILLLLAVM